MSSLFVQNDNKKNNNDFEIMTKWLDFIKINMSKNTFDSYKRDIFCFINFFIKDIKNYNNLNIQTISLHDVRSWIADMQKTKKKPSSRSRAISVVKNFFEYCVKNNVILNNPINQISFPKKESRIPRSMDFQSIEKIINQIKTTQNDDWIIKQNIIIILLTYGSGLRISESLSIKISDISDKTKNIQIKGKGGKYRVIPLLDNVYSAIMEYIKICPYIKDSNSLLFFGKRGMPLQRTYFANFIQKIRESINLPKHITPHAFRHSCATHLLNNGTNIRIVQELLGHSSLNSTQIYTKVENIYKINEYKKNHPNFKIHQNDNNE